MFEWRGPCGPRNGRPFNPDYWRLDERLALLNELTRLNPNIHLDHAVRALLA